MANGGCNEGMLAGKRTQADLERRLRRVVSPCEQVEVAAHSAAAEIVRISTVVDVSCAEALGQPQLAALPARPVTGVLKASSRSRYARVTPGSTPLSLGCRLDVVKARAPAAASRATTAGSTRRQT